DLLPLVADAARAQGFTITDVDAAQASLVAVREGAPVMLVQVTTPPDPTGMVEPPCQGACKTTFVVAPLSYDDGKVAVIAPVSAEIGAQAHALLVAIEERTSAERHVDVRDPGRFKRVEEPKLQPAAQALH